MDFLIYALFSEESGEFCGADLVNYELKPYSRRPATRILTYEELAKGYRNMFPVGFEYNCDTLEIWSDTPGRKALYKDVLNYVIQGEGGSGKERDEVSVGVTDVVLWGMEVGAFVCPNYVEFSKGMAEPIMISMRSFNVSHSSFNVYASYKIETGEYRTMSLLDARDGSMRTFYVIVPNEEGIGGAGGDEDDEAEEAERAEEDMEDVEVAKVGGVGKVINVMTEIGTCDIPKYGECTVYEVNAPLIGAKRFYGEAFINFIAYSVMWFNTGSNVLRGFMKYESDKDSDVVVVDEGRKNATVRKIPRGNVDIKHEYYGLNMLKEVLREASIPGGIDSLLASNPGASPTWNWLNAVLKCEVFIDTLKKAEAGGHEDAKELALKWSAQSIYSECKESLLVLECELLDIRYYLYKVGLANSPVGAVLEGGGVDGCSYVKRSGF